MDKWQALQSFWESFDIPAYDENSVYSGQESPTLPYITYEAATGTIGSEILQTASVWYKSNSWAGISQKAEEIGIGIGYGGKVVPYDGGVMWIKRGQPFAQRMSEPDDDSIRRIVINVEIEYISEN